MIPADLDALPGFESRWGRSLYCTRLVALDSDRGFQGDDATCVSAARGSRLGRAAATPVWRGAVHTANRSAVCSAARTGAPAARHPAGRGLSCGLLENAPGSPGIGAPSGRRDPWFPRRPTRDTNIAVAQAARIHPSASAIARLRPLAARTVRLASTHSTGRMQMGIGPCPPGAQSSMMISSACDVSPG